MSEGKKIVEQSHRHPAQCAFGTFGAVLLISIGAATAAVLGGG